MTWRLIDEEGNVWTGNVADFNLPTANNFYSFGAPSRTQQFWQGGGGRQATIVFVSEDFFETMIDGDRGLDFSDLQPSSFGVVSDFFAGNHDLEPGSYIIEEISQLSNLDGRSFEHYTYLDGTFYDAGSIFQSDAAWTTGFALGSYVVSLAPETTFVVGEDGQFVIEDFGYTVDLGDYDFDSANVSSSINGVYSIVVDISNPLGWVHEPVIIVIDGVRYVGTVDLNNFEDGFAVISFEKSPWNPQIVGDQTLTFSVNTDGIEQRFEAPEGSTQRENGTIVGPDGRVLIWVSEDGVAGLTTDSSRDRDNQPVYSETLLDNYGVVVNGQAQTTFLGTARAAADALGFDGSFGIDGSFRVDSEGNERGGNGPISSGGDTGSVSGGRTVTTATGATAIVQDTPPDLTNYTGGLYPVIIDLDGDGIEVLTNGTAYFDLDSDGYREETSWVAQDDGFLIVDLNGNGIVDHPDELILSNLGNEGDTDLQALARLYDDQEPGQDGHGVLNTDDDGWSMLHIWRDLDSDGVSDPGEVMRLDHSEIGITEINLTYDDGTGFADTSNDVSVFGTTLLGSASMVRFGETVEGGVGDIALAYDLIAPEIRDTDYGFEARIEAAGEDAGSLRYIDLSLPGQSADRTLGGSTYNGVYGDSRDNKIDFDDVRHDVLIDGGRGNDTLDGSAGDDQLFGGIGNDQLASSSGDDVLDGGKGNDFLRGEGGDDYLDGGEGSDRIFGGNGNDTIVADFLDLITAGQASSRGVSDEGVVRGGSGTDTLIVNGKQGVRVTLETKEVEIVLGSGGHDRFDGGCPSSGFLEPIAA